MSATSDKPEIINHITGGGILVDDDSREKHMRKRRLGKMTFQRKNYASFKYRIHDEYPPHSLSIPDSRLQKHDTGAAEINPKSVKTDYHKKKLESMKKKFLQRIEQTTRAELLNSEEGGYLISENKEPTYGIQQKEICAQVDIASATKHFDLNLDRFGPYRIDYTPNGRNLIIGGKRGHIAAFDWMTKKLHFEISVLEGIRDVQWLHVETMFAVAQKRWTYIYDDTGVEIHCLKVLHDIKRLEFLPRHFLLVAGANTSFLHYLDVSMGKLVQSFRTRQGPLDVMAQNPNNGIIFTGHGNGTVQLWSPNSKEPLVKFLAHRCALKGISVEGDYIATSGLDRRLRIWDVRTYKQLYAYVLPVGLSDIAISQRNTVACGIGNVIQIFQDAHKGITTEPYLIYRCSGVVSDLRFCPYEDVLGAGHQNGLTSLLVPGCGEPNFDALRTNPYESKNQRREREVRQLLDKIQPELIALDTSEIAKVNIEAMEEEKRKMKTVLFLNPREITYTQRHKKKGGRSAIKKEQRKQGIKAQMRFEVNQERKKAEAALLTVDKGRESDIEKPSSVLDRFNRKDL